MYGLQCHKRLWLQKKKPSKADPTDAKTQAAFDRGIQFGLLAQDLFPGGVNAQGEEKWHSQKTAMQTAAYLQAGAPVIYEAAFMFEEVICAIDILVKSNGIYRAYEVKSAYELKPQHLEDAALQYFVMKGAGLHLSNFSLIHMKGNSEEMGPHELRHAFETVDITEYVVERELDIYHQLREMKLVLNKSQEPHIEMGEHCSKPYVCNFVGYCSTHLF